MNDKQTNNLNLNRRDFLTTSAMLAGGVMLGPALAWAEQKKPKEIIVRAWGGPGEMPSKQGLPMASPRPQGSKCVWILQKTMKSSLKFGQLLIKDECRQYM